jgi:hypothetical protein
MLYESALRLVSTLHYGTGRLEHDWSRHRLEKLQSRACIFDIFIFDMGSMKISIILKSICSINMSYFKIVSLSRHSFKWNESGSLTIFTIFVFDMGSMKVTIILKNFPNNHVVSQDS